MRCCNLSAIEEQLGHLYCGRLFKTPFKVLEIDRQIDKRDIDRYNVHTRCWSNHNHKKEKLFPSNKRDKKKI